MTVTFIVPHLSLIVISTGNKLLRKTKIKSDEVTEGWGSTQQ
jgi:hypothetical protein